MRIVLAAGALLALAGCGEGSPIAPAVRPAPHVPVPDRPPPMVAVGEIRGQSARDLVALFGPPSIDLQEGPARKLQFLGAACVLDAYLYPRGRGEPVVTHLDARRRDGNPVDPASCIAALGRQPAPR